jgi:hypothetical protein
MKKAGMAVAQRSAWYAVALLLPGCVTAESVVRTKFARDQHCTVDAVIVEPYGGTQYLARGCDRETRYACGTPAGLRGLDCMEEGIGNPPGYHEPEHPVNPPPDPRMPYPNQ